ncbi:MAG TPA: IPT/TIG domain-containing protein, partial [Candidatus Eisenbacteria bacterium]|nr:IPT/TIG domain-containing protein [Candidatus Eisenbacteria bacterium]
MNTASKSAYCVVSLSLILMLALMLEQALHAQTQPIQYYYDSLGRLVTTVDQFGNVANYSYDAVGNITQIARSTVKPGQLAIFDFNPQIGPVGISVTIQGQGFSATASSDIVKFNGVTATVTSAATKTLVATVPVGATTGPISVTLKGNTATSSTNFVVAVAPVITSLWPRSALFNTAIPNVQVTGSNLLGAIITFNDAAIPMICFSGQCITSGPQVSVTSIGPT